MKTIAILLSMSFLAAARGAEDSPLQYLIGSLRVQASGGVVEETTGKLEWPKVLDREPAALAVGHSHGYDAGITIKWRDDSWVRFLAENGFRKDRVLEDMAKSAPALQKLFGSGQPGYSRLLDLPRLGVVIIHAYVEDESGDHPKLSLFVGHHTRYFVAPKRGEDERDGSDRSAIVPAERDAQTTEPSTGD